MNFTDFINSVMDATPAGVVIEVVKECKEDNGELKEIVLKFNFKTIDE